MKENLGKCLQQKILVEIGIKHTRFKVETLRNSNTKQINIALGQGKGLNQFNNIIEFQLIKIIKK